MPTPAIREPNQAAPFRAIASRKPKAAPPHPAPNYATREETMKAAKRIMDERAELFRRLANA